MSAWAMPGGKMIVYTDIVEGLELADDEITVVTGHGMIHALLEYSREALSRQVLTGLGGSILANSAGMGGDLVGLGADLLTIKPSSRHQENETDVGGVCLMVGAGYDPKAAVSVWEKMNKVQGGSSLSILSTRLISQARISTIRKMLPEVVPTYQKSKR